MSFTPGTPKPEGSGIKKGQKQYKTLEKEERRAIFDAEVSKLFKRTIKKARPEYLLDQFIGKAPDVIQGDFDVVWLKKNLSSQNGGKGGPISNQNN